MNNSHSVSNNQSSSQSGVQSGVQSGSQLSWRLEALLVWLAAQVIFLSAVAFAFSAGDYEVGLFEKICRLDCQWYLSIVSEGYMSHPINGPISYVNWPFFPAFPALVAMVISFTGLSYFVAAYVLNALLMLGFCFLGYKFSTDIYLSDRGAVRRFFFLFLLASPYSLFLSVAYTEMLFNVLLLGVIVALVRERFFSAGVLGMALVFTRINGVVLPIMLAADSLFRFGPKLVTDFSRHFGLLVALAIMPLSLVALFFVFAELTGDPFAWQRAGFVWHRYVGRNLDFGFPAFDADGIRYAFSWASCIIASFLAWRMFKLDILRNGALFILGTAAVLLLTSMHDTSRYFWALFPLYVALAYLPRRFYWGLVALGFTGKIYVIYLWTSSSELYFLTG